MVFLTHLQVWRYRIHTLPAQRGCLCVTWAVVYFKSQGPFCSYRMKFVSLDQLLLKQALHRIEGWRQFQEKHSIRVGCRKGTGCRAAFCNMLSSHQIYKPGDCILEKNCLRKGYTSGNSAVLLRKRRVGFRVDFVQESCCFAHKRSHQEKHTKIS